MTMFIDKYSFMDLLIFMAGTGALGLGIMILQGRATLAALQGNLIQGQMPTRQVLNRSLVMLGGFLLFLPGIMTDALGFVLIMPGLRHLLVFGVENWLKLKIAQGAFKAFQGGQGFSFGAGGPMGGGRGFVWTNMKDVRPQTSSAEREVIEINPTQVTSSRVSADDETSS